MINSLLLRNINLLKMEFFFRGSVFINIVLVIYFQKITSSYTTAALALSTMTITTLLTEISTGVLSDKIGRKKTLILSGLFLFLTGVFWFLGGYLNSVLMLFLGSFFMGIHHSLSSGTDEALLYETLEELGKKDEYKLFFSRVWFWRKLGGVFSGLFCSGIIYFSNIDFVALFSLVPMFMPFLIAFFYYEPLKVHKSNQLSGFKHFLKSLKEFYSNKKLRFYTLVGAIDEGTGEATHNFEAAFFSMFIPVWALGVARLLKNFWAAISFIVISFLKKIDSITLFFFSSIGNILIKFTALILNNIATPFVMTSNTLFWGIWLTSNSDILHKEFTPQQRATMGSIASFLKGIFTGSFTLIFGIVADLLSPKYAIFLGVIIQAITISLSLIRLKYKKKNRLISS